MRAAGLSLALSVALASCGLLRAHDDSTREEAVHHVTGTIYVDADRGVPIVVALLRSDPESDTLVVTDHTQLFHAGTYDFLVTPGRYRVVAFEDADRDVRFDDGERVNSYDDFRELIVDGSHPTEADIRIDASSSLDRALPPIVMGDDVTRGVAIGAVVPEDDERLSETSGQLGAWEPVRFMQEGRAGIFQLSEHDPARVPVVLVHGFAGWGRQFDGIVSALDHTRFEPWIVAYPSGWSLEDVARLFRAALNEMLTTSPSERVCVVAHSMGGLVSWRMLTEGEGDLVADRVRGLVTLASPLGGHPRAADGLRMSPVIVRAWRDLAPDSELVRAVSESTLPSTIRYTLLFDYLPDRPGDGVVPLSAQLPTFAQHAAARMAGFETSHTAILDDAGAIGEVMQALETCATREAPPPEADPCDAPPPALDAYDAITADRTFSLAIVRDERGAWSPVSPLGMPHHHASRIAWTDDAHLLDAAAPGPVLVIATGAGRLSLEQDDERHTWFATYGARVEHVCPMP